MNHITNKLVPINFFTKIKSGVGCYLSYTTFLTTFYHAILINSFDLLLLSHHLPVMRRLSSQNL